MDQHSPPKILMVLTLMAFKKALKIWFFHSVLSQDGI